MNDRLRFGAMRGLVLALSLVAPSSFEGAEPDAAGRLPDPLPSIRRIYVPAGAPSRWPAGAWAG